MKAEILSFDGFPVHIIAEAAGMSTGKESQSIVNADDRDKEFRRVKNCYIKGHMSIFEFVHLVFRVSGISRACSHQLVRHRLMSFCQRSQRYVKIDTSNNDWYVMPQIFTQIETPSSIEGITFDNKEMETIFKKQMSISAAAYNEAIKSGIKPEDARYLLPEATKTSIEIGTNLREFYHFLNLREDKHAQWEIRELAYLLENKVKDISSEWRWLMGLREGKIDE